MSKKKTQSGFEPTRVALAVAALAAVSLLSLAVVATANR
jgi:hypothetical protein